MLPRASIPPPTHTETPDDVGHGRYEVQRALQQAGITYGPGESQVARGSVVRALELSEEDIRKLRSLVGTTSPYAGAAYSPLGTDGYRFWSLPVPEDDDYPTVIPPLPTSEWVPPRGGTIVKVYDGDTPTVVGEDGRRYAIRVPPGNTLEMKREYPELKKYAEAAKKEAHRLLYEDFEKYPNCKVGRKVQLHYSRSGQTREGYNRLLARVTVELEENGKKKTVDLTEHMIAQGLSHCYFLGDEDWPPAYMKRLLKLQNEARRKGLGFWKEPLFQTGLFITSFHANGRGFDPDAELIDEEGRALGRKVDPNVEYFRMVNTSDRPINLSGYTVTNAAGDKFHLPPMTIPVGHAVRVLSGRKPPYVLQQNAKSYDIYLGSKKSVWNNQRDLLTITDPRGNVVAQKEHKPQTRSGWRELPAVVSSASIKRLGADVVKEWITPQTLVHTPDQLRYDDGDTHFIPLPEDGTFKLRVNGGAPSKVALQKTGEADEGYMGVRYYMMDTLETKFRTSHEGKRVYASQGPAADWAKAELIKLLTSSAVVLTQPLNKKNPMDYYGRLLAEVKALVEVPDADEGSRWVVIDVNKWMLQIGAAVFSYYYDPEEGFDRDEFLAGRAAAEHAVENRLGLWSDDPQFQLREMPADFRKRNRGKITDRKVSGGNYVADFATGIIYTAEAAMDRVEPHNQINILARSLQRALEDDGFTDINGNPFRLDSGLVASESEVADRQMSVADAA